MNNVYICGLCGVTLENIDLVKDHMRTDHEDDFFSEMFDEWADSYIMEAE